MIPGLFYCSRGSGDEGPLPFFFTMITALVAAFFHNRLISLLRVDVGERTVKRKEVTLRGAVAHNTELVRFSGAAESREAYSVRSSKH